MYVCACSEIKYSYSYSYPRTSSCSKFVFRNDISVEGAATLMINPATALRMIKELTMFKQKNTHKIAYI